MSWQITRRTVALLLVISLILAAQVACGGEPGGAPEDAPAPALPAPDTAAGKTEVRLLPIVEGLQNPTSLTHAGDERLLVTEQAGTVQIITNGQVGPKPFLDITDRVGSSGNEQGLLSLAFHPTESNLLFVYYTNRDGDTIVARFQHSGFRADPASETVVLTVDQPYSNHNGGQLQFGPDGLLYVGLGDGGAAGDPENRAQDLSTLLGKLLRLDVAGGLPYAIPPDNPFADLEGARPEVYALGLRNPWRFAFDGTSGDLYIADVGQNAWEELNVVPAGSAAGADFGWNRLEGDTCYESPRCQSVGTWMPAVVYDHGDGRCSITGGFVYRGQAYPAFQGSYFFGDYCRGTIWRLQRSGEGWQIALALESGLLITSFGEDVLGELYVLDRRGAVYRLEAANG